MTTTKTKKTTKSTGGVKAAKKKPAKAEASEKKMSALDAAAKVLSEKGVAMTCRELIGVMAAKGYWSSPNGKTPDATLAAAIQREIATKGKDSRFVKTAPGRFAAPGTARNTAPDVPVPTPPKPKKSKKAGKAAEPSLPDDTPAHENLAEPA